MAKSMEEKRINQIISFLKSLKINSNRFYNLIDKKDKFIIQIFNESLTHSSGNKEINYEKLEFFGDAVLRLAASNFIDKNFTKMSVGGRSALRAQIVSDEWLTKLGNKIEIETVIAQGPKALGDKNSKDTIIAEATEALIGAIYKCFNSIEEVNLWLDDIWTQDSEIFLKAPYKFNAKSALQEWCQKEGFNLPEYKISEVSQIHGDEKRFKCEIYINGFKKASSFGQSHKRAEKNTAGILLEKLMSDGKI